jgi:hypothetical protein
MEVKDQFLQCGRFKVHDGTEISFWDDNWVGDQPLKLVYPNLYQLSRKKHVTVADVLSSIPLNMSFRRALSGHNLQSWYGLVEKVLATRLTDAKDVFIWNLHKSGIFSTRSMYMALISNGVIPRKCPIWKIKVLLKIKIFLWYIKNGVTLLRIILQSEIGKGA